MGPSPQPSKSFVRPCVHLNLVARGSYQLRAVWHHPGGSKGEARGRDTHLAEESDGEETALWSWEFDLDFRGKKQHKLGLQVLNLCCGRCVLSKLFQYVQKWSTFAGCHEVVGLLDRRVTHRSKLKHLMV